MAFLRAFLFALIFAVAGNLASAETSEHLFDVKENRDANRDYSLKYNDKSSGKSDRYWIALKPGIGMASFIGDISYYFSFADSGFTEFESMETKYRFKNRLNWDLGIEFRLSKFAIDLNYSAFAKNFPLEKEYYQFGTGEVEFQSIDVDWRLKSLNLNVTRYFGDLYYGVGISFYKENTTRSIADSALTRSYDYTREYSRDLLGLNIVFGYNHIITENMALYAETAYYLVFDSDYSGVVMAPPLGPTVSYYNDLDHFTVAFGLKTFLQLLE